MNREIDDTQYDDQNDQRIDLDGSVRSIVFGVSFGAMRMGDGRYFSIQSLDDTRQASKSLILLSLRPDMRDSHGLKMSLPRFNVNVISFI